MNCIQLLAVGETDPVLLEALGPAFDAELGSRCEILEAGFDPMPSLHLERRQPACLSRVVFLSCLPQQKTHRARRGKEAFIPVEPSWHDSE